jgi:hypothetical protein
MAFMREPPGSRHSCQFIPLAAVKERCDALSLNGGATIPSEKSHASHFGQQMFLVGITWTTASEAVAKSEPSAYLQKSAKYLCSL